MGSVTVTISDRYVSGSRRFVEGTLTLSSTYATDGDTITVNDFEASQILKLVLFSQSAHFTFVPDLTNNKIKAYENVSVTGSTSEADSTTGALAEDAAGTETVIRMMGSSTNTTYRIGTSAEVSANHDLSGETVDFRATILP